MKKRGDKHNHFLKGIVFIISIITIFLIISSNVKEPMIEEEIIEETSPEIEKLGEEFVEKPIEEVPEETVIEEEVIEEKPKTFISEEECKDGVISLNLNNLYEDKINVKWSTFFCSGKIMVRPGCDKESLEPGESTFCSNVCSFPRKNRIRVAIAIYKHTTVGTTVDCGSNLVTGSAVKEPFYYGFNPIFFIVMFFLLSFVFNYYRVHY